jgi:hypothetical protein
MQVAMLECPQGDVFALFVDPVSLFCHDTIYSPGPNWQKDTKAMEELGIMSITDQKAVASYNLNNSFWFTEGKQVVVGKVISAFATADKWLGFGGMNGRRVKIEHSVERARDCVRTGVEDRLPVGGKLAQLATRMLEHTQAWIQTGHKHLDSELTKLTQMGIPAKESLILLLEMIIIMFNHFYTIWHKRMDFTVKGARLKYMVWCIWIAMQVHMAMDRFVKDGMRYNPAISAAFVWFLTKQMGSNVRAGVGSQMSKLEDWLKLAEYTAKEATKKANEATKCASLVGTSANAVMLGLAQLFPKNSTLKK